MIEQQIPIHALAAQADRLFELAAAKVMSLETRWDPSRGAPVFTVDGIYTARGWTEWTQGFQYGCAILVFDATDHRKFLDLGRSHTLKQMAAHVSHVGVHDHGFNNLSTYGNLRRLMYQERLEANQWELDFYEFAIKVSGAVQANRWSPAGYVYSFNGPHSLFIDTIRSMRILGLAHQLGHVLMGENDRRISLLNRLVRHCLTTAKYNIYYGQGRDAYDVAGRTAHEAIFNSNDNQFRCPNSQQGYSPFTTWTRGLAWAILGFAEELEFLKGISEADFEIPKAEVMSVLTKAARATADFYIDHATAQDGIPYWDTGAPNLHKLGDWRGSPADPFNEHEPVDSSAAAIASQGLIRLGNYLGPDGTRYLNCGLAVAKSLFSEPYLSLDPNHQGLILHSVYHRPNGWDHIPAGRKVPCGESSMWGDYHALELALLIRRIASGKYLTFFETVI